MSERASTNIRRNESLEELIGIETESVHVDGTVVASLEDILIFETAGAVRLFGERLLFELEISG